MKTYPVLLPLKRFLPESAWPWVLAALRQDPQIWDWVNDPSNLDLWERSQTQSNGESVICQPNDWSPASLALLALGQAHTPLTLQSSPLCPLEPALRQRAIRAYESLAKPKRHTSSDLVGLAQAGLLALALRERCRLTGSWQGLADELARLPLATWRTPLACLLGIIPDAPSLLAALLPVGVKVEQIQWVLHAYLCQPLPPEEQVNQLASGLNGIRPFPPHEKITLLRELSVMRPGLAKELATMCLNNEKISEAGQQANTKNPLKASSPVEYLESLAIRNQHAELSLIAHQPVALVENLVAAQTMARLMQANLIARQAEATPEMAVEFWQQALTLAPNSPHYTAGLVDALREAGNLDQAAAALDRALPEGSGTPDADPALLLASSRLSFQSGDLPRARQAALHLFENGKSPVDNPALPTAHSPQPVEIVRFLLDLSLPVEAEAAARLALSQRPDNADLLALHGLAQMAQDHYAESVQEFQLAVALIPERRDLHYGLAEALEAAGEWNAALIERLFLADGQEASSEDIRLLAACATQAGKFERAESACHELLAKDPDDGLAYTLLGEIFVARGQPQTALDHFTHATNLAPHIAQPWLALARTLTDLEQPQKVLETLRTAVQALPGNAEIHLAHGEACLACNAPTQALPTLQRAADLTASIEASALKTRIALRLGQTQFELRHLPQARQTLESAYRQTPNNLELAHIFARVLVALGEKEAALPALATVIAAQPDDPAIYLEYARALLETHQQIAVAISALRYILAQVTDPISEDLVQPEIVAEAQCWLAEALAAHSELIDALQAFQTALESDLARQAAWKARLNWGLAQVAVQLDRPEVAIAALQEAAQADPQNHLFPRLLAEVSLAVGLSKDALEAARVARRLAPEDLDTLLWFIDFIQQMRGTQPQSGELPTQLSVEVLSAYEQVIQLEPERIDLRLRLGNTQIEMGEIDDAKETLRGISDRSSAAPGELRQAGQRLLEVDDALGAVTCLEKAVENISKSLPAPVASEIDAITKTGLLVDLAQAYRLTNNFPAAIGALDQAISLDPLNASLYTSKVTLLIVQDQPDDALACIQTGLAHIPDNSDLHLYAAKLLRAKGDLAVANTHAKQLAKFTDQPDAIYVAADLARATLQYDEARQILSRWSEDGPPSPEMYCLQAELALAAGEEIEAAAALTPALGLDPHHPRVLALQARLATRRGDPEAARQIFEEAFEAGQQITFEKHGKPANAIDIQNGKSVTPVQPAEISNLKSAIADAAFEIGEWDAALGLARQSIELVPNEAYSHTTLARLLIQRAEYQHLCNSLEVVTNAPGAVALGEEAEQTCDKALQTAQTLLTKSSPPFSTSAHSSDTPSSMLSAPCASLDASLPSPLTRWTAHSHAAFHPGSQSTRALAAILEQEPGPEDTAAWLAAAHLSEDTISRELVERAARQAARAYPRHTLVQIQSALALAKNDPQAACLISTEAINSLHAACPPFHALTHFLLARIACRIGEYNIASEAVAIALGLWPDEPRWHAQAAEILRVSGEASAAIKHLERAIMLEPRHLEHHLALGKIYLGEARNETSQILHALKAIEKACRIDPAQPEPWLVLAEAQRMAGDYPAAAASADQAIHLAPNQAEPLRLRAEIALSQSDSHKAEELAQKALELQPNEPGALLVLSHALEKLRRPAQALAALETALPALELPLPILLERVRLLNQSQGAQTALDAITDLAQKYPTDPTVLAALARSQANAEQYNAAIENAQQALKNVEARTLDNRSAYDQAELHALLGRLLRQVGQLDQAIAQLNTAIHLAPNLLEPYLELGFSHQARRQHLQALQIYRQATKVAPNDPRAYFQAGLALKDGKDYLESEAMLRRAADLAPQDVNIHTQLAAVVALNLIHNRRKVGPVQPPESL